jgi:hypothetical protein
MSLFWKALMGGRLVTEESLAEMRRPRSEPEPGESRCYGLGFWLRSDSPEITMSGADAGVSFWSAHHPALRTTATVIGNTMDGAWPVAEVIESWGAR